MKVSERIGLRREIFTGSRGERVFTVRPVAHADVPAVLALQEYIMSCLPDAGILVGVEEWEIAESVELDFCAGIFDGQRLAAFALMVVNRDSPRNLGKTLGFPLEKSVYFDIVFVHPDYRGYGIQSYTLALREEIARGLGAELGFVTVSPDNAHSLKNVMDSGFEIYDRRLMYTGVDRYILKKRFA